MSSQSERARNAIHCFVCTKNVYSEYVNLHLNFIVVIVKYSLPITDPTTTQKQVTDTRIAILYRNEHDMTTVKEVFGDGLTGMNTVTSRDPHSFKELLLSPDSSVRSCFIVVESTNMKEKLLTKSNTTVYQDLLKTAGWKVGKNIFASCFLAYVGARKKGEKEGAWLPLAHPFFYSFIQILPSAEF